MRESQWKRTAVFLVAAAVLSGGSLTACNTDSPQNADEVSTKAESGSAGEIESSPETVGGGTVSGTFTGMAQGFGGEIKVTLTIEHNQIVDCILEGNSETTDVGGKYIPQFQEDIVRNNGEVDVVSGATVTSNGVKAAVQNALSSAGLGSNSAFLMKPGTYRGKAHGFSCIDYVQVSVNVTEDRITDIHLLDTFQTDRDSYENRYLCQGAYEIMGPEIVEHQSLDVDGVTGATGSSNGIKAAVRNALEQAYIANGISETEAQEAVNQVFTGNKKERTERTVKLEYDVVVVGAGAAGATASLTALDEGARVLNIEKTFRWGGQSMMTGGPKAYNPETSKEEALEIFREYESTIEQHRFGEEDRKWNDETYRQEHGEEYTPVNQEAYMATVPASGKGIRKMAEYGMHFVESSMGNMFASEGGETVDIDIHEAMAVDDSKAITPEDVESFESRGMGNSLSYSVAEEYYETVFERYVQAGGDYLLKTTAKELIYSDDSKTEITGVRAYGEDGTIYEVSAKAVVLATGGYGGNEELMDQWALGGKDWIYYGWQGNDGDGIIMALDAGANPYNLEAYPMSHQRMGSQFITKFPVQEKEDGGLWSPNDLTVVMAVNSDGVYVTETGEAFDPAQMGGIMGGFSGAMGTYYIGSGYYVVYTQEQLEKYRTEGFDNTTMGFQNVGEGIPVNYPLGQWVDTVLQEAVDQGWAWNVDSLEEGDKILGFEEGTLAKSCGADSESYFIMKCCGLAISSCGGVEVNGKMQAVKADKTAIENLFIAGNDGFGNIMATGAEYPIGGDAGMFVFGSGYIAGEEAAHIAVR